MKLYDTLAGDVVEFEPRIPGEVSIYACGPTVYDHPHLGHARQSLTYDIIRRYFEWTGLKVHHVANITDIDDNIINRAKAEGSTEPEIAARWTQEYDEVMAELGILLPHDRPKATEYVEEMVELIAVLIDNGSAYANDSGVYLRVRSVEDYGALVHRTPDELAEGSGARVEVDDNKEDPLDFALWKAAKPGEPTWPSPWGDGRPGWHIECAAMSLDILGEDFDLHGGGRDLVFPHHTNERAEAIAAGKSFARYWVHNAFINVGSEKMSKSLNNFKTVRDVLSEDPLNARAIRLVLLQTHYRKDLEINPDVLTSAREALKGIDAMVRRADAAGISRDAADRDDEAIRAFKAAMDHDFGTPEAVATIFDLVRRANTAIDSKSEEAGALALTALELANSLGLAVGVEAEAGSDVGDIEGLLAQREEAKKVKDYATADQIRDDLTARGITVEDTAEGPLWYRS